jgi:DNA-binding CsgD family transcriptional regulator
MKALILIIIFLPGIIADIGWFHMKQQFHLIPTGFYFTSVLYIIWNSVFLFDVSHYLISPINSKETFQTFCTNHQLSEREQDICSLLLNGLSNALISKHLFIEESTVKKHLQNIYKKTNSSSRFELTQRIQQKGH